MSNDAGASPGGCARLSRAHGRRVARTTHGTCRSAPQLSPSPYSYVYVSSQARSLIIGRAFEIERENK
eukprot:scaffold3721_cov134-Isochrysis_galbana.AAC.10